MNNVFLFIFTFFFAFSITAQENSCALKKGNKAYEGFSYKKAINHYEKIESPLLETKRRIAISYWKIGETTTAENLFSEIVLLPSHLPQDICNYASILRENKKYQESEKWMKRFLKKTDNDSRAEMLLNQKGIHYKLLKPNTNFIVRNLQINSEQQDFAPVFLKEGVVFASSREGSKGIRRKWNQNQLPFLDVYFAKRENDNNLIEPILLGKKVSGKYHDGPVTFNKSGDQMIITRNNYEGESTEGVIRLQLFIANYKDGVWEEPKPLPFNSNEYSVGHAAYSGDGKWLYFASNMPGGIGGADLYKAKINEDGTFGEAINLGRKINTEGDELFPFVHPTDEMLFFASDGRPGLGGLDVFLAQLKKDNTIGSVSNLGAPVNSNQDDFGFSLSVNQESGYFSSNRSGGKGSDDIYSFLLKKPFSFAKKIKGIARNDKNEPIAGVEVVLFDLVSGEQQAVITNKKGEYEFMVAEDKSFNLRGHKSNYFDARKAIDTYTKKDIITANLTLEKNPKLILYTLITNKQNAKPLDSVTITIKDNMTRKIISKGLTSFSGDYFQALKDKKLLDIGSYNFLIEKKGYLSKTITYNVEFINEGKYNVHEKFDLGLAPISVGRDLAEMVDIKPIYFDLGSVKIRPDAGKELDKIVNVMNQNPTMVIELASHTDSRGSASSNLLLSDKRAKASAKYIAERITNPERIYGKGYGESVPKTVDLSGEGLDEKTILNESFIEGYKTANPEKYEHYHQMNRRTEFIIIKM